MLAKAMNSIEDIFKKDNTLTEIVNKSAIFNKLIQFL